jgi:flagellar FliL protein
LSKDQGSDGTKKKKPKKKLIIILIALVLAVTGGGVGGYLMFAPTKEEPPPEPGAVVKLDPITINLTEGHYLKLGLALQATAEVAEEPDGSKALDIAIDLFSNRSVAELSSNDERNRMKKELTELVEKAYEHEIMDVYLTEFVMQ